MGELLLATQSAPTTPSAGNATAFLDTTSKSMHVKDDAGLVHGRIENFSTTSQAPAATTRTYIAGSALTIPTSKLQIGTKFRWTFNLTKTGAGAAASTIDIAFGTAGTTADTARVSFTKPAGTAVIDEAFFTIEAIVRGPISASGIVAGTMQMTHNLSATGHAVIPCVVVNTVSAAFDVTTAGMIVGLCLTSGASDVVTIQCVDAEAVNI